MWLGLLHPYRMRLVLRDAAYYKHWASTRQLRIAVHFSWVSPSVWCLRPDPAGSLLTTIHTHQNQKIASPTGMRLVPRGAAYYKHWASTRQLRIAVHFSCASPSVWRLRPGIEVHRNAHA